MLQIIETRKNSDTYEERIVRDDNRLYYHECRILPVEDWEPRDGWCADYVSSIPLTLDTMKEARARASR